MSTQHDRASNLQNRIGEHSQLRLENGCDTLDEGGDRAGMPACLSYATGPQKLVAGRLCWFLPEVNVLRFTRQVQSVGWNG